jgi:hypothetical protein
METCQNYLDERKSSLRGVPDVQELSMFKRCVNSVLKKLNIEKTGTFAVDDVQFSFSETLGHQIFAIQAPSQKVILNEKPESKELYLARTDVYPKHYAAIFRALRSLSTSSHQRIGDSFWDEAKQELSDRENGVMTEQPDLWIPLSHMNYYQSIFLGKSLLSV